MIRHPHHRPRAFTIAELIVTAIVAIILTAIAIPSADVGNAVATDGTAQLSVETAASAEVSYYTSAQSFTASPANISNVDPSITYVSSSTPSASSSSVSVATASNGTILGLAALGENGVCWMERRSTSPAATYDGPVLYGSGTLSPSYACTGTSALAINATSAKFITTPAGTSGSSWDNPLLLP
jgi:Tfp pilus assembly protein PilE